MNSFRKRLSRTALVLTSALMVVAGTHSRPSHAEDLQQELDALEDLPEDDLSPPSQPAAPAAPEAADPLDSLPEADDEDSLGDELESSLDEETPPPEEEEPKKPAEPEAELPDESLEDELDLDEPKGLKDELDSLNETPAAPSADPQEALTGVNTEAAGQMTALDFRQFNDRVRITIRGNRSFDWNRELRSRRRQVIVELRNATIGKSVLKRALDTGEFDGPVALVQAFESKIGNIPTVKVLFQLRQFVDPTVVRSGSDLNIDFPIIVDNALFKSKSTTAPVLPETFLTASARQTYTGAKITLNVKDADLPDVLNLLSKTSGKNFVLGGGQAAKVTLNVQNVPWDQAFQIILLNAKLGYQKINDTYRIVPVADLRTEIQEATETAKKAEELTPVETRLFALNYARAADVTTSIKDFLSTRGKTSVDQRTNSVAITDLPSSLDKVDRYIKSIDRQTSQILIEARIVEARQDFTKSLSIDWKVGEIGLGRTTGAAGRLDNSFVNLGGKGGAVANTGRDVDTTGGNGGLRLQIGQLGDLGAIQALLGLAESENKAKVIASPRVTTVDNKQATIQQGDRIPVVTPGAANLPPTTGYVDATLRLDVTPQVTTDGFVMMKINLRRDIAGSAAPGQTPGIQTRSADTEMLVESGKTAVIGGIYTMDRAGFESGWPGLRSLPLVGALFRNAVSETRNSNELLMFIAPKILNSDKALLKAAADEDAAVNSSLKAQSDDLESVPEEVF